METPRFVVLRVDTTSVLLRNVRGAVILIVEPDVMDMALTLERKSVSRPSN